MHVNGLQRLKSQSSPQREFLDYCHFPLYLRACLFLLSELLLFVRHQVKTIKPSESSTAADPLTEAECFPSMHCAYFSFGPQNILQAERESDQEYQLPLCSEGGGLLGARRHQDCQRETFWQIETDDEEYWRKARHCWQGWGFHSCMKVREKQDFKLDLGSKRKCDGISCNIYFKLK